MKYLPFLSGKYSVAPGLKPINKATGVDRNIFQIDGTYPDYFENKRKCRKEGIPKYYSEHHFDQRTQKGINTFLINQLLKEYPQFFHVDQRRQWLKCKLSGDSIGISDVDKQSSSDSKGYLSLFDALCSQVQEDLAVIKFSSSTDWLAAVHLCAPNHWSAKDKIGKSFDLIHEPVPGMEKMRKHYYPMLKSVIEKGPFYRFGWGISTDDRLNHHPEAPTENDLLEWTGRHFDTNHPKLYLRVERQTLTGFKYLNAILFTIRTFFYDVEELDKQETNMLIDAIESMSLETLVYKGLKHDQADILGFLNSLRSPKMQ